METAMKPREVASYLSIDPMTVYNLIKRGQIPAFKVGKVWRIRRNDLEVYIEEGKQNRFYGWAEGVAKKRGFSHLTENEVMEIIHKNREKISV
ncbi:helix-turn-helix domain-containing protein [bacterium]|nr:helix-turn-helix domain-containing protein [bacterium]MBU1599102.1 helix-turn-helix domain-containing protein [bacterium]MBU2461335.1 helix-turn-helix domain-containing protein [bacterium]